MKVKILMVCLGNICRSPLAEGILKSKLDSKFYSIDSCGTSNYHIGNKPDPRSIEVARKYGIDITDQKAAQFKKSDFATYDRIYIMDSSNYKNVIQLADKTHERSKVDYILNAIYPDKNLDVPDPYYGGKQGFEDVYNLLNEACEIIAKDLKEKN